MEIDFTSWWWVSLPRATGILHSTKGIIDKTPPYFRKYNGRHIMEFISHMKPENGFRVMQLDDYNEEESLG